MQHVPGTIDDKRPVSSRCGYNPPRIDCVCVCTKTSKWLRTPPTHIIIPSIQIFIDGRPMAQTRDLQRIFTYILDPPPRQTSAMVNIAANPDFKPFPRPYATYTWETDAVSKLVDGIIFFDNAPDNRWTSYKSPNGVETVGVELEKPQKISQLTLYLYDDGRGVGTPQKFDRIEYWEGGSSTWKEVESVTFDPPQPKGNRRNVISFTPVVTSKVQVTMTNPPNQGVGLTEFEIWVWLVDV